MALVQTKQDATEALVNTLRLPESGVWASATRNGALARLREMGLPARRDEYWKYTDPADLTRADAHPANVFAPDEIEPFAGIDRLKIVFVDGEFDGVGGDFSVPTRPVFG